MVETSVRVDVYVVASLVEYAGGEAGVLLDAE